jgi:hypothetical protein
MKIAIYICSRHVVALSGRPGRTRREGIDHARGPSPPCELTLKITTTPATGRNIFILAGGGDPDEGCSAALPNYADLPGLGDEEYPGFSSADCPEELPELREHHSIMAEVLRTNPDIYASLRTEETQAGVGLANIIKPEWTTRAIP